MRRALLVLSVSCLLSFALVSAAEEGSLAANPSAMAAEPPFASNDPALTGLWREGHAHELAGRYVESARVYEEIAGRLPAPSARLAWRIARNHYLAAKGLPLSDRKGRMARFELTEDWAARGIEADPSCAECNLYKFIGMSRRATTQGIMSSARNAKEMAALLDRAFELSPSHVDNEWNSELANLYYAAGVFYRSVPESSVMRWTIGVKGDLGRSIELLRKANEITGVRIDYHIELGAALQCAGSRRGKSAMTAEGRKLLEAIPGLPDVQPSDSIDREHAVLLIQGPDQSCDYSREAWIEKEPS